MLIPEMKSPGLMYLKILNFPECFRSIEVAHSSLLEVDASLLGMYVYA